MCCQFIQLREVLLRRVKIGQGGISWPLVLLLPLFRRHEDRWQSGLPRQHLNSIARICEAIFHVRVERLVLAAFDLQVTHPAYRAALHRALLRVSELVRIEALLLIFVGVVTAF